MSKERSTYVPDATVYIDPSAIIDCEPMRSPALARKAPQYPRCVFGLGLRIGPYAVIYRGSTFGSDVFVGEKASVREGCTIGDRCIVGLAAQVGHDVVLENEVKIQSMAFIVGGTRIGSGSFIGQGVIMSNDDDPRDYREKEWKPPIIGRNVMIGAGAIIRGGVIIGDNAVVAMGALVVTDVPAGAAIFGLRAQVRP